MTITPEDIAAFADGELSGKRKAEVAAAINADPDLEREVERHRQLGNMLSRHFDPIADQAIPDRLAEMLAKPQPAEVVDFAAARDKREAGRAIPRWGWIAGPALAASLALAIFLPGTGETPGYVDGELAATLDQRLVAEQDPSADMRILLSFRDDTGQFCRAFSGSEGGGIACRDDEGWKLEVLGEGSEGGDAEYRMAGAGDGDILALVQELAAGPALDAEAEAEAKARGWR